MTEIKIVIIQHFARGEGITGMSISRPQKSTLNLTSLKRSVMQKKKVMCRRSGDITEEQSDSEIRRRKVSRSENVDKIYKIVMRTKFHVCKERVRGMIQIPVKSLTIS